MSEQYSLPPPPSFSPYRYLPSSSSFRCVFVWLLLFFLPLCLSQSVWVEEAPSITVPSSYFFRTSQWKWKREREKKRGGRGGLALCSTNNEREATGKSHFFCTNLPMIHSIFPFQVGLNDLTGVFTFALASTRPRNESREIFFSLPRRTHSQSTSFLVGPYFVN